MYFDENDIDFSFLTPQEFEELCFDLLMNTGFHSLIWRQGGADDGRDIECFFTSSNPLIGPYNEKWFVECKLYSKGVPVDEVSTKFDWAQVEQADHLLIITSSYLSNSTRAWIEKRKLTASFRVDIIEGKLLRQRILGFTELVIKYFKTEAHKILLDSIRTWKFHNIMPSQKVLEFIVKNINPEKLTIKELAFIWSANQFTSKTFNITDMVNGRDVISLDFLAESLILKSESKRIMQQLKLKEVHTAGHGQVGNTRYGQSVNGILDIRRRKQTVQVLYSLAYSKAGDGIEVLLSRGDYEEVKVTHIQANAEDQAFETLSYLADHIQFSDGEEVV